MKYSRLSSVLTVAASVALIANAANAASFTGYDQNNKPPIIAGTPPSSTGNPPLPLTIAESPNSQAAYNLFVADTNVGSVTTEGFESFSTSPTTGQTINGLSTSISGVNATFAYTRKTGTTLLTTKVEKADTNYGLFGGVNGNGTYPTEGNQGLSINSANNFSISFASPLRALGYFGTDLGDNSNVLTMIFTLGGAPVDSIVVPTFAGGQNSSKFFFGYIGDTATTLFDKVEFSSSLQNATPSDAIGIDQLRVATAAQITGTATVVAVPEPTTILGTLLFGGSVIALKRRQRTARSISK